MALNIKDAKTDLLARELVKATGESLTQAVTVALEERLVRVRRRPRGRRLADDLDAIAQRCARLPVLDSRSPDAILGYDERGLPT
jgi:antitoxin VapB